MTGGAPAQLLRTWLADGQPADALAWLDEKAAAIRAGAPERTFFLAYSGAARRFPDEPLTLGAAALRDAARARDDWNPGGWTARQAARALLMTALPSDDAAAYTETLDKLFASADMAEQVAGYQALPILPRPEALVARAREGTRTNITTVFEAIAHKNPFPRDHFPEDAWNNMVLKALFVGVALAPIIGLDERANPALMRMLCDYAHERWAAARTLSPELWRCVGPFADDDALNDFARVLRDGDENERAAAILALRACPRTDAAELLAEHPGADSVSRDWNDFA